MDIHQLRIFCSVFRYRSFSKASAELHLSQPTVSDHVRSLEEELGVPLFDRLGRSIVPTREAETLYGLATEIIEKADHIKGAVRQLGHDLSGELVVGASTIPGTYLLPRFVVEFTSGHPAVFFRAVIGDSSEIIEKIKAHELLLGIVGSKPADSVVHAIPFVEDELIVASRPQLIGGVPLSLDDLTRFPLICREEGSGTRREFERYLTRHGKSIGDFRIAAIFGSTDAVKQAAKAGLGVAVLSRFAIHEELRCRSLSAATLSEGPMKRSFYLIVHRKRTLPNLYAAFLEYLKSCRSILPDL